MKENAPQLLGQNEAHEEANMMKVAGWFEINPGTAEDYERAYQAVEEIKRMAADEPLMEKMLNAFARLGINGKYAILDEIMLAFEADGLGGMNSSDAAARDRKLKVFDDAAKKLSRLKEYANRVGKNETEDVANRV